MLEDGKIHIKFIQNPADVIKMCKCRFVMCGIRRVDDMVTRFFYIHGSVRRESNLTFRRLMSTTVDVPHR